MSHYPNPFDFVPFPRMPILRTEQELDALGPKLSGYLEFEIKALTPVHIVGKVERDNGENRSSMYLQDGRPCIPASTIRGCLRAFVEAVTAGWVSQATPEYPKKFRERHVGFRVFEDYTPSTGINRRTSPPAVGLAFRPGSARGKLDVASYLFGFVAENKQAEHGEQAQKSKVWIEDAYLDPSALNASDYWIPDIAGKAFMGGAKPSASTWWYFEPAEVWSRSRQGGAAVAEFVGEHLRGRKFYFHQDPVACAKAYHPQSNQWLYNTDHPFRPVRLECMDPNRQTLPFRVYLDGIPRSLFLLLMSVLRPGARIRHKLGYGKAFGYGSIEFVLKAAYLRSVRPGVPSALKLHTIPQGDWSKAMVAKCGLTELVDRTAVNWLARILGWPHSGLLFMYPQYRAQEFQQTVPHQRLADVLTQNEMPVQDHVVLNPDEARTVAGALWNTKRTIDFRLFQERARGWKTIAQRQP